MAKVNKAQPVEVSIEEMIAKIDLLRNATKAAMQRLEGININALRPEDKSKIHQTIEELRATVRDIVAARPNGWKQPTTENLTPLDLATILCSGAAEALSLNTHSDRVWGWLAEAAAMCGSESLESR